MAYLIAALMVAVLAWIHVREKRATGQRRSATLNDCAEVLAGEVRGRYQQDGFPVLTGQYAGKDAVLRATVDTLIPRKLPSLWLEVSILTPIPYTARLSYLLRPVNTEFFSPSSRLARRLDIPADWPQEAAMLRTDEEGTVPSLKALAGPLRQLCADRRVKEVVVTPRGVRIIYLADEGERGTYLLLRQARFDPEPIDGALARSLLESALGLAETLCAAQQQAPSKPDLRVIRTNGRKGRYEQESIALEA
ncbi:hypothetical protein A7A08_01537 [Methyloligella halotolerans]|uniref:Uncharacterized protein n=1 Tax=Methyloligella halotolerans TaxID=1177755 RepID=A0A1E2RZ62_9HYPH|nr:hypothetical protein [Methyloligella halotolerans]ODA67504.1 hypothetical protein A7A08_01537 [Methyloligella halotolerans]